MIKRISEYYRSLRVRYPEILDRGRTDLMINAPAPVGPHAQIQFGGVPSVSRDEEFAWPECTVCKTPMQFLAQFPVPHKFGGQGGLLYVFMCGFDDEACSIWESDSGANKAFCGPVTNLKLITVPTGRFATTREICHGATIEHTKIATYEYAKYKWGKPASNWRQVLGQMGHTPSWIQGDEFPPCDKCGKPMRYVAQLEEGPDSKTAMNFGGGCGYVFDCACDDHIAKFLWQC